MIYVVQSVQFSHSVMPNSWSTARQASLSMYLNTLDQKTTQKYHVSSSDQAKILKFDNTVHWQGSWTFQESSRKTPTSALFTILKPLTVWITTNWKILREMGIPDHLTCLLRKLVCRSRSNSQNQTQNNRLVQNWERSTSSLYIVTLLI